jgi:MFS transporter, PAT family, beta-lactamase induction signal transducer AmpG
VYRIMAACVLVGVVAALIGPEPPTSAAPKRLLEEAVIEPLRDYFKRAGAIEMLAFIILYKFGDNLAATMTMPFYLETGFTKTEIGALAKTVGMGATIVGGFIGGAMLVKLGLKRALWVFGFLQALSTAGFWLLARAGADRTTLTGVIGFENLTAGMGMSAYAALLMTLCNKRFTATQYALLTSLMALTTKLAGASSGYLAKTFGWETYFMLCALAAVPGMLMLLRYDAWTTETSEKEAIEGAREASADA